MAALLRSARNPEVWKAALCSALVASWTRDFSQNHLGAFIHAFYLGLICAGFFAFTYYAWSPQQIREPGWSKKKDAGLLVTLILLNLAELALTFGTKIGA